MAESTSEGHASAYLLQTVCPTAEAAADDTCLDDELDETVAVRDFSRSSCRVVRRCTGRSLSPRLACRKVSILAISAFLLSAAFFLHMKANRVAAIIDQPLRRDLDVVSLALGENAAIDGINCFVDVDQAVLRFANAVVNIKAAMDGCKNLDTNRQRAVCSDRINGIIYNFIFVAGMIAQAVSDCARTINAPAACTASVAGFLGNVDVVIGASSSMTVTCDIWWKHTRVSPYGVTTTPKPIFTTYKPSKHWTTPKPTPPPLPTLVPPEAWYKNTQHAEYQTSMVKCWIGTNQGIDFLTRASITIVDAVKWCHPVHVKETGVKGQKKCAVDMISLLGSLGLAARFLSLAVPACEGLFMANDGDAEKAKCAADISGVFAGVMAATAPAMMLKKTCDNSLHGDPAALLPIFPDGRRLRSETNST